MNDDEILKMMFELDALRAALLLIADYDVDRNHGYTDEWTQADAFRECQKIASEVIAEYKKELAEEEAAAWDDFYDVLGHSMGG